MLDAALDGVFKLTNGTLGQTKKDDTPTQDIADIAMNGPANDADDLLPQTELKQRGGSTGRRPSSTDYRDHGDKANTQQTLYEDVAFVYGYVHALIDKLSARHHYFRVYLRVVKFQFWLAVGLIALKVAVMLATCEEKSLKSDASCGSIDHAVTYALNVPITFFTAHIKIPYDFVVRFLPWLWRNCLKHIAVPLYEWLCRVVDYLWIALSGRIRWAWNWIDRVITWVWGYARPVIVYAWSWVETLTVKPFKVAWKVISTAYDVIDSVWSSISALFV